MSALVLERVSVNLGGRRVLSEVDVNVEPASLVAVLGANGSGKTTLLRAALGLVRREGSARLFGQDVSRLSPAGLAERAGYLAQERRLAWGMTARRVAGLGAAALPPRLADRVADEALARVGAAHLADRSVFDMSGGERARVLLARLLATRAPLLVLDEPVAGLDPDAQLATLDLLRREASAGQAIVVTLHDLSLAARYCDRVLVLAAGRVLAYGPPREALSPAVLRQGFGLHGQWIETEAGLVLAAKRA